MSILKDFDAADFERMKQEGEAIGEELTWDESKASELQQLVKALPPTAGEEKLAAEGNPLPEDNRSNRELFAVYMTLICARLIEAFPLPVAIDAAELNQVPHLSYLDEEADKLRSENYRHHQEIIRGTLLFMFSDGFIESPGRDVFNQTHNQYVINACRLTGKGYSRLFQHPDDQIEALLKKIAGSSPDGADHDGLSLDTFPTSIAEFIVRFARSNCLKGFINKAIGALPEQSVGAALNQLGGGLFG